MACLLHYVQSTTSNVVPYLFNILTIRSMLCAVICLVLGGHALQATCTTLPLELMHQKSPVHCVKPLVVYAARRLGNLYVISAAQSLTYHCRCSKSNQIPLPRVGEVQTIWIPQGLSLAAWSPVTMRHTSLTSLPRAKPILHYYCLGGTISIEASVCSIRAAF